MSARTIQFAIFTLTFCVCGGSAILRFLIPVQMSRGLLPSARLLDKYGLGAEFGDLVISSRQGDLARFDASLSRALPSLRRRGTLLLLQQTTELYLYRNLLRRVWRLRSASTRLPLTDVLMAVRLSRPTLSDEEVECMVANLIYRGLFKAEIAQQHRMLVISPQAPFPRPAEAVPKGPL